MLKRAIIPRLAIISNMCITKYTHYTIKERNTISSLLCSLTKRRMNMFLLCNTEAENACMDAL